MTLNSKQGRRAGWGLKATDINNGIEALPPPWGIGQNLGHFLEIETAGREGGTWWTRLNGVSRSCPMNETLGRRVS